MNPKLRQMTSQFAHIHFFSRISRGKFIIIIFLIFQISIVIGDSGVVQENPSPYVTYGDFIFVRQGDQFLQINSVHFSGNESDHPAIDQIPDTFLSAGNDTQNITLISQPTIPPAETITARDTEYGTILTDSSGKTLYFLANDIPGGNTSACNSELCSKTWPPFFADPIQISPLSTALNSTDFSSFVRLDGTNQTTYHGWPLYYFVQDTNSGDMKGQGSEKSWYIAGISGMIPVPSPPVTTVPTSTPIPTPTPVPPPPQQWYAITFHNGGVAVQAETPGFSISSFNQSQPETGNKNIIHGGNAGIFQAGSGLTTIENVTFQSFDGPEIKIDPKAGYSILIKKISGTLESPSNETSFNDSSIYFRFNISDVFRNYGGPTAMLRMNNGEQYAVNITFSPPGPAGYHLKLLNTTDSVVYDIDDWINTPKGVTFDPVSGTASFDPRVLKNESITYTLEESLTVTGITPSTATNTREVRVVLSGTGFRDGTMVYLTKEGENSISASHGTVPLSRQISCILPITTAASGTWNVIVENPDDTVVTLPGGFTITPPISLPFFPGITLSYKSDNGQTLTDSVYTFARNLSERLLYWTKGADFGINNITDLSSIQIRYVTTDKDTSPSFGWKFRSDLQSSGVYDDGGNRPVNTRTWIFRTGGPVSSTPAVAHGTVFLGSTDSYVYAIDMITGTEKWKFKTGGEVLSSPAVINNTVYVGSNDHFVYAIDATEGKEIWRFQTGSYVGSSPSVWNGVVYVGSGDNYVYAIDAARGQEMWRHEIPGSTSPVVFHGTVFFGSFDSRVYALDAMTGQEKWKFQTGDSIRTSPAVGYGSVFFGSDDHMVYAIDVETGLEKWRFSTGGRVRSSPAVAYNTVYFGSDNTWVYAVDALTGTRKWMFETGNEVRSSPAVANGMVYVGSYDTYVYALDAVTGGREKWMIKTGGNIDSSPVVANGLLVIGNSDGNVYAYGNAPYHQVRMSIP